MPAFECVVQGGFVDHAATGDVEDSCTFLHGGQFWAADHALGAGDERRVDGEEVGDGEQGWERVDQSHGGGSGQRRGSVGVEGLNMHAKSIGQAGDRQPN